MNNGRIEVSGSRKKCSTRLSPERSIWAKALGFKGFLHFTILDRYMLTELAGPFGFGLGAFTLIFAATEILNVGKLVSSEHAPLWAALLVFLWSLAGVRRAGDPDGAACLERCWRSNGSSSDSEITAMKAAGITFARIVAAAAGGRDRHVVRHALPARGTRSVRQRPVSGDREQRHQSYQRVRPRSHGDRAAARRRPPIHGRDGVTNRIRARCSTSR